MLMMMLAEILLPDVVLVQIKFVLLVFFVRGDVTFLRVAAILGANRACRRFVVEFGTSLGRVRDQLGAKLGVRRAQLTLVVVLMLEKVVIVFAALRCRLDCPVGPHAAATVRGIVLYRTAVVPRRIGRRVWLCFI